MENLPSSEQFIKSLHGGSFDHVVVVESDAQIIGFGTILHWQEADGTIVFLHQSYIPSTISDYESTQKKLLQELQKTILEMSAKFNTTKKVFAANTSSSEKDFLNILVDDGYNIVWSQVEMEFTDFNSLLELQLPTGFEIRSISSSDYRKLYDANKSVYQNTWGATPASDEDFQEFLEDNPMPNLWTVAWQDDKIAGFVLSHIANSVGVVNEVSILPEFRRLGLAKSLLTLNLELLKDNEIDIVRLHTDSESRSGARHLYESLGFKALKDFYRLRKQI